MSEERIRRATNSKYRAATDAFEGDPEMLMEAVDLLKTITQEKVQISALTDSLAENQGRLAAICEAYSLDGVRHGLNCFEYHGWQTRKTLSRERLLELGVSAEIIEAAYTESKPYLSTRIVPFDTL